jgi:hypothetical protein
MDGGSEKVVEEAGGNQKSFRKWREPVTQVEMYLPGRT